jgi:predicted double-glycine peptidase
LLLSLRLSSSSLLFTKPILLQRVKLIVVAACLWGTLSAASPRALWLDVPFVKQSPEGCGAASIAMVMQYWSAQQGKAVGKDADDSEILRVLRSPEAHGIYASDMERYFGEHGYRALSFKGKWEDIAEHVAKGRPLIVALQPVRGSKALHYVVVAGIDERGLVMFNDPAGRKLSKLDRKTFEKGWKATSQWTLLAVPESGAR